ATVGGKPRDRLLGLAVRKLDDAQLPSVAKSTSGRVRYCGLSSPCVWRPRQAPRHGDGICELGAGASEILVLGRSVGGHRREWWRGLGVTGPQQDQRGGELASVSTSGGVGTRAGGGTVSRLSDAPAAMD